MEIKTDNKPRDLVEFYALPTDQKQQFDYVHDDEKDVPRFVWYKHHWYDVHDTLVTSSLLLDEHAPFRKWDSYQDESYFTGVLFKFVDDGEQVICGRYYS